MFDCRTVKGDKELFVRDEEFAGYFQRAGVNYKKWSALTKNVRRR